MSAAEQQVPIQVVGSSTFGRYNKISGRKVYNFFESDDWLVPYSGWKKIVELVASTNQNVEGRGFFRSIRGNIAIAVINSTVWRLDPNAGALFIGNLATTTGPVFMDENLNSQIGIVDQLSIYVFNRDTNGLTRQASVTNGGPIPDDLTPNYIRFHNNYFLIGNNNTTGNGARWYALIYSSANALAVANGGQLALETKADFARAIIPLPGKGNNVLVMGTAVSEVQNNSPIVSNDQVLLYQRVSSINIYYGVLSVSTIAWSETLVVWLAVNEKAKPVIMVFDGKGPRTISTDGINHQLGILKHPEKSIAFIYEEDGHTFYQIAFYDPADNLSLFVDLNTEKFYHTSDANLNYHPARQVVYIGNKSYFISINNGAIYQLSTNFTTYDENIAPLGSPRYDEKLNHVIPRQIIGDNFMLPGGPDVFRAKRLYLTVEQGADILFSELRALQSFSSFILTEQGEQMISEDGQNLITERSGITLGYEPKIDFSYSRDGSVTFSREVPEVLNFSAIRQNITRWIMNDRCNSFTPKWKFWSKGRIVVHNAFLMISR